MGHQDQMLPRSESRHQRCPNLSMPSGWETRLVNEKHEIGQTLTQITLTVHGDNIPSSSSLPLPIFAFLLCNSDHSVCMRWTAVRVVVWFICGTPSLSIVFRSLKSNRFPFHFSFLITKKYPPPPHKAMAVAMRREPGV